MAISLSMLQPGGRLPDQEDVARGLSVSPVTARRGLMSLAEDGVLVRRRGRSGGTFVADQPSAGALRQLVVPAAEYLKVLEQLYGYFIPYPIDQLHLFNHDHIGLVRAWPPAAARRPWTSPTSTWIDCAGRCTVG